MDSVPSWKKGQGAESGADGSRLDTDGPASALPPAVLHEVLVNDRRRAIVDRLHGTRSLRDLADDVARIEAGGDDPDRKTRQSVYITLHQCHLPKLDEFGVVAYDADRKRVEPADGLWAIRSYRDRVDEYWARQQDAVAAGPYLGLGLLGAGCLAVGTAGVAPTAAWAVASATLLAIVGLAGRTVWARRGK